MGISYFYAYNHCMIRPAQVESLTTFQKNLKRISEELGVSKEPMVLTVNGRAKLVVQDADAYGKLLDEVERARFVSAIREGIEEARAGQGRPAEQVYEEMRSKYGLPR